MMSLLDKKGMSHAITHHQRTGWWVMTQPSTFRGREVDRYVYFCKFIYHHTPCQNFQLYGKFQCKKEFKTESELTLLPLQDFLPSHCRQ